MSGKLSPVRWLTWCVCAESVGFPQHAQVSVSLSFIVVPPGYREVVVFTARAAELVEFLCGAVGELRELLVPPAPVA